jgi:5-methylcytosine-specific restriction endonuclease McrA
MKRRKPLKRRATDTVSKLKQHLWQLCRQIIIQRHGDICYCCGARGLVGSNLHVGHFIPSSVCSAELRYSLDNLRPSCYRCNIHLSGNWPAYEQHLRLDGIDPEELKRRNRETTGKKYDVLFYRALIDKYQAMLESTV